MGAGQGNTWAQAGLQAPSDFVSLLCPRMGQTSRSDLSSQAECPNFCTAADLVWGISTSSRRLNLLSQVRHQHQRLEMLGHRDWSWVGELLDLDVSSFFRNRSSLCTFCLLQVCYQGVPCQGRQKPRDFHFFLSCIYVVLQGEDSSVPLWFFFFFQECGRFFFIEV